MTKKELNKCEDLCLEAIRNLEESDEKFQEHEKIAKGDYKLSTVEQRLADNKRGYAEGINQVLAILNYKSENMTKLNKLI